MNIPVAVLGLSALLIVDVCGAGLQEKFTWTRISYAWPEEIQHVRRQTEGQLSYRGGRYGNLRNMQSIVLENYAEPLDYQYENNIPMSANVWKNKVFITVPRRRLGVPSTLNYIPLNSRNRHNIPLLPYPSWEKNSYPDSSGTGQNFISVYRIAVDECDRLWFIDTGLLEIPGNATQVKPTTLVIMDLNTDQVLLFYEIPGEQLKTATQLASLTVDSTKDTCEDAFAYIPDLKAFGLIIYSLKDNRSWRINHNYFNPETAAARFFISGHNFQWNDGIFSVELSATRDDGYKTLYFHSMAGTHMYEVSTRILRNETLATRAYHSDDFQIVGDRGTQSQTSSADIHKSSGVMFLGLVNQNALACWNTNLPLSTISLVQRNDRKMIYPSDVKVYKNNIYVLTNNIPEFIYGRLNYDEVNFRVWSNTIEDAIQGTICSSMLSGENTAE